MSNLIDRDELLDKLLTHFGGKIVRKDLTKGIKKGKCSSLCTGILAGYVLFFSR